MNITQENLERAKKVQQDYLEGPYDKGIVDFIAEALQESYERGLEKAAELVELDCDHCEDQKIGSICKLSLAIRALKEDGGRDEEIG